MIDVRTAVTQAINYFQSIQDLFSQNQPLENLALEEVELTEDGKFWLVTLGFSRPHTDSLTNSVTNTLLEAGITSVPRLPREYKTLKVDAETGEVKAVKIRQL